MGTDANQEWIDARKELDEGLAQQHAWQERYMPVGTVQPGQPLRRGDVLTEEALEEVGRIEKRVEDAQKRYNAAWQVLRG